VTRFGWIEGFASVADWNAMMHLEPSVAALVGEHAPIPVALPHELPQLDPLLEVRAR